MRNLKLNLLLLIPLAGALLLGCTAKPKPSAAREPSAPEMAAPAPVSEGKPTVEDARRQRMLQRAGEVFKTIYFPYDQATLDERARQTLAEVRGFLMEYPEVPVTVEGHADERGTTDYNMALGDQRAGVVAAYLASLGVPKTNVKSVSYGEEKPAREGHSEADWKLNRRAEFAPVL
jgi:peptidoglycan-associated lipoprotein